MTKEKLPEDRLRELLAMTHYNLEDGCDAWVEMGKLFPKLEERITSLQERLEEAKKEIEDTKEAMEHLRLVAAQQATENAFAKGDLRKRIREIEDMAHATYKCDGCMFCSSVVEKCSEALRTPAATAGGLNK